MASIVSQKLALYEKWAFDLIKIGHLILANGIRIAKVFGQTIIGSESETTMLKPRYYLMTPAMQQDNPIDVICVTTEHNLNALLNFRRTHPWVSLVSISAGDAYNLLKEYGQAGIGCFIGDDGCSRQCYKMRRSIANLKVYTLQRECKSFDLYAPVPMQEHVPTVREVAREVLTLTFSRGK